MPRQADFRIVALLGQWNRLAINQLIGMFLRDLYGQESSPRPGSAQVPRWRQEGRCPDRRTSALSRCSARGTD